MKANVVFSGVGVRSLLRILSSDGSLASPRGLRKLLDGNLPPTFEDLAVQTAIVATNMATGTAHVIESGNLPRAALASAAIPLVFPSVELNGLTLVDGGVVANVPLRQARSLGAKSLIVFDAGYPCALRKVPRSPVARAIQLTTLMLRHQGTTALALLKAKHVIIYLPSPCPVNVAPYDFSNSAALIRDSYQVALAFLESLKIEGPGLYGYPHSHEGNEEV